MDSRLRGIEGLRALAACVVVLHHVFVFVPTAGGAPVALPGPAERLLLDAQWGLVLFFALSGFLLFRPFAAAILRGTPAPDPRRYLRSRALRILPAYWAILLVVALVAGTAIVRFPEVGRLTDPGVLLPDLLLAQGLRAETLGTGIGPAWSLAVEAVFYLALPLLAAAAALRLRRRVLAACAPALVLLALGLAGKALAASVPLGSAWRAPLDLSFLVQADLFAPGMLAAVAHVLIADGRLRLTRGVRRALAGAALAGAAAAVLVVGADGPLHGRLPDTLVALACGLALVALLAGDTSGSRALRVLEARPVVLAGLASYSVYLWHTPVVFGLTEHGVHAESTAGLLAVLGLVAVITAGLSWASYRWVEAPALARRYSPRRPNTCGSVSSSARTSAQGDQLAM